MPSRSLRLSSRGSSVLIDFQSDCSITATTNFVSIKRFTFLVKNSRSRECNNLSSNKLSRFTTERNKVTIVVFLHDILHPFCLKVSDLFETSRIRVESHRPLIKFIK